MKNIYILPTTQPSKLFKHNLEDKELNLSEHHLHRNYAYNIYITSDEEIKKGYCLDLADNSIVKVSKQDLKLVKTYDKLQFKNIILTTDPTLITDGVQAIDDEFLEWFVKNPTWHNSKPKQETLEEAAEKYTKIFSLDGGHRSYAGQGFIDGAKWQAEQLFKDDAIQTLEKGLALLLKKQERMYSEEEVLNIILKFNDDKPGGFDASGWFEQNKKK